MPLSFAVKGVILLVVLLYACCNFLVESTADRVAAEYANMRTAELEGGCEEALSGGLRPSLDVLLEAEHG